MRVAKYLGFTTVAAAKKEISPMEFLRWRLFIALEAEDEAHARRREDWYAAQIALWVYRVWYEIVFFWTPNRERPKPQYDGVKDFLIEFKRPEAEEAAPAAESEDGDEAVGEDGLTDHERRRRAEYLERSKGAWKAAMRVRGDHAPPGVN
jgi:hypothetical protein